LGGHVLARAGADKARHLEIFRPPKDRKDPAHPSYEVAGFAPSGGKTTRGRATGNYCMMNRDRQLLHTNRLILPQFPRPTLIGSSPLMGASEIVRELRRLRYDPANGRGRGRKEPLKRIAEQAGMHRATLYRIIRSGRVSDNSRVALSLVFVDRA
jgi:hypothetical protein